MRLLPALMLFLLSWVVHAQDVALMVNMNYSTGEYKTFRRMAEARGQTLVVVPPVEAIPEATALQKRRERITAVLKRAKPGLEDDGIDALLGRIVRDGLAAVDKDPALRQAFGLEPPRPTSFFSRPAPVAPPLASADELLQFRDATKAFTRKEAGFGSIDSQIRRALDRVAARGDKVRALAVSTHSTGTTWLSETSYSLDLEQFRALVRDYPQLMSDPTHVILAGCYTLTSSEAERWRTENKSSATLIAGYDGQAPLRTRQVGWSYIEQTFAKADEIEKAGHAFAPAEVKQLFQQLSSFQAIAFPAVDYCGVFINKAASGRSAMPCRDQWDVFSEKADEAEERFLSFDDIPAENPPASAEKSPLRDFYNYLQGICPVSEASGYSSDARRQAADRRDDLRERAIRTIFWKNVQRNFGHFYARRIPEMQAALRREGFREALLPLDGSATRIEFLRQWERIQATLRGLPPARAKELKKKLAPLRALAELRAGRADSTPPGIPAGWIEPNSEQAVQP